MNSLRPTIRIIAKIVKLSPAAVSMALKNHPRISRETCLSVQRVAEELGYCADPLMSRLMTQLQARRIQSDREVLALVMNYRQENTLGEVFLVRLFTGLKLRAAQLGYNVQDFNLAKLGMTPRQLSKVLYCRGIQGVLLAPFRENKIALKLDFKKFATVVPSGRVLAPHLACSTPDQFSNMLIIMRRLQKLGYRRIAFHTNETLDLRTSFRFTGAYMAAMQRRIGNLRPLVLIDTKLEPNNLLRWLKQIQPEVLITTEALAYGWLCEAGYSIPGQLGFVSTSYSPELFPRTVSGIDEQPEQIGAAAVDLLAGQLARNEVGVPAYPRVLNVEGAWTGDATLCRVR